MANFIKDSLAELEHVVWPTHIETKKFFMAVVGIIVSMALFTYLLTIIFGNSLFGIRSWMYAPKNADLSQIPTASSEVAPQINVAPIDVKTADGKTVQVTPKVEVQK